MKEISEAVRLQAIGTLTVALQHRVKVREFELAAIELLGIDEGGHLSDMVWSDYESFDLARFDKMLELEGLRVADDITQSRNRS